MVYSHVCIWLFDKHSALTHILRTYLIQQHYERSIFELKEFVDSKARETDYEMVKAACLKITASLNSAVVKQAQLGGGVGSSQQGQQGMYNAQAKW